MREYLQRWFIKYLIHNVFHTLSKDDILRDNKWKGKELSADTIATLQIQARALKDSLLWTILKSELQWLAAKTLLERGSSETDIRVAQIAGFLTQVIDDKLEDITK